MNEEILNVEDFAVQEARVAAQKNDVETIRRLVKEEHIDLKCLKYKVGKDVTCVEKTKKNSSEYEVTYYEDENGNELNLLHLAVIYRAFDVIKEIVEKKLIELNDPLIELWFGKKHRVKKTTPLSLALKMADKTISEYLIENHAVINSDRDADDDLLNLIYSPQLNDDEGFVRDLIERRPRGNTIDFFDRYERSPLFGAALRGYKNVLKLVLNQGVSIDLKDSNGDSALHSAASGLDIEMMKLIISLRVSSDVENKYGYNILHKAAASGANEAVIQYLLGELKFDINRQTLEGFSPLHKAIGSFSVTTVKIFLNMGADLNLKAGDQTPLLNAVFWWVLRHDKRGNLESIIELLIDKLIDNGEKFEDLVSLIESKAAYYCKKYANMVGNPEYFTGYFSELKESRKKFKEEFKVGEESRKEGDKPNAGFFRTTIVAENPISSTNQQNTITVEDDAYIKDQPSRGCLVS